MRTICVDFDGVLAEPVTNWIGPHTVGQPKPGALAFIVELYKCGYRIVIFTTRANSMEGHSAVREWLHRHDFPLLEVTSQKLPALLYIDDRGYRFSGNFEEAIQFVHEVASRV